MPTKKKPQQPMTEKQKPLSNRPPQQVVQHHPIHAALFGLPASVKLPKTA